MRRRASDGDRRRGSRSRNRSSARRSWRRSSGRSSRAGSSRGRTSSSSRSKFCDVHRRAALGRDELLHDGAPHRRRGARARARRRGASCLPSPGSRRRTSSSTWARSRCSCDVDLATFNVDPVAARGGRHAERTVGMIPVHLFGLSADMDPILELAREHGLWVVEDAACAFGDCVPRRPCRHLRRRRLLQLPPAQVDHDRRGRDDHDGARRARRAVPVAARPRRLALRSRPARVERLVPALRVPPPRLQLPHDGHAGRARLRADGPRPTGVLDERRGVPRAYDEQLAGLELAPDRRPCRTGTTTAIRRTSASSGRRSRRSTTSSRLTHPRNALMATLEERWHLDPAGNARRRLSRASTARSTACDRDRLPERRSRRPALAHAAALRADDRRGAG